MRSIIFRAKRLDTGEWIYGSLVHQTDYYGSEVDHWYIVDGTDTEDYDIGPNDRVDSSTIGQKIGMCDKNLREIYENDIIKGRFYFGRGYRLATGVVAYFDCGFKAKIGREYKNLPYSHDCQIIGNLSENPELIQS